mmetsp:Transcript_11879/g.35859  ORF Transcript_11879/g.35859 Transcript_11879/m.35859 type:complete len:106 (+) Transcript_11879:394-711(+)
MDSCGKGHTEFAPVRRLPSLVASVSPRIFAATMFSICSADGPNLPCVHDKLDSESLFGDSRAAADDSGELGGLPSAVLRRLRAAPTCRLGTMDFNDLEPLLVRLL